VSEWRSAHQDTAAGHLGANASRAAYSKHTYIAATLIALGLPVATAVILRATHALPITLPPAVLVVHLFSVQAHGRQARTRKQAAIALGFLVPAFAALTLTRILIIPYSLYDAWFRMIQLGRVGGSVAQVFVYVSAVMGSLIGGSAYSRGLLPALAAGLLTSLVIAGIVLSSFLLFFLAVPTAAVTIALYQAGGSKAGNPRIAFRLATGLVLVAALAALGPAAFMHGAAGNRYIDTVLSPGLRDAVLRAFPNFPMRYGVGMYGYSLDSSSLGGRPSVSWQPVFEVEGRAGERIYLRTEIYDVYSGTSWERSAQMLQARRRATSLRDDSHEQVDSEAQLEEIAVTFLTDMYEAVPHTLSTRHVAFPDRSDTDSMIGHLDTGYRFDLPPGPEETIRLHRYERTEDESEPQETGEYLQIPPELPEEVRQLARRLEADQDDPRAILRNINNYLSSGEFTYTLETDENLEFVDFVDNFLFDTKEGYCVQFATSFTVLARLNDIPTRYATGFLVNVPHPFEEPEERFDHLPREPQELDERTATRVSGLNAHAWPEVWLPDKGWTTWEATPPMQGGEFPGSAFFASEQDDLTRRQLEEIAGDDERRQEDPEDAGEAEDAQDAEAAQAATDAEQRQQAGEDGLGPFWAFVFAIGAATIILAAFLFGHRRLWPGRLPSDTRGAINRLALQLIGRANESGIAEPHRIGYRRWGAYLARLLPKRRRVVERTVDVFLRTMFAGYHPSRVEVHRTWLLSRSLRRTRLPRLPRRDGARRRRVGKPPDLGYPIT